MKKLLLFLATLSITWTANAQRPFNNQVIYVPVAPSGACPASPPIEVVISTGALYTCNAGTWSLVTSGGGTTTNALTAAATGGAAPNATFNGSAAVTFDYHSFGAPGLAANNTFTGNQTATGLTLTSIANAAAPTGVATNSGQSVPASATNMASITCIGTSGVNTTLGVASANVTTTGGSSYIVWSYTLPTDCTSAYLWLKNSGSFAYYTPVSGTSFQQNAIYSSYTAAASYPAGGAYPTSNTTGLINGLVIRGVGTGNVNVGGAIPSATTGTVNVAIGGNALSFNSTGSGNTAIGDTALFGNTTGGNNTAVGRTALYTNTTGGSNTATGFGALNGNTTASNNTANGLAALYANTTGANNTASGYQAGRYIADGSTANTTSGNSVYIGYQAYPLASGDTDEDVFGNAAIGHGSNTVTLGDAAITGTWLNGTQHIVAAAPVASVCGACAIATYSTNAGGAVTGLSTDTTVTITFANSGWTNAAFCTATPSVALATPVYNSAQSKTAVTFTFAALTGSLYYHCDGN